MMKPTVVRKDQRLMSLIVASLACVVLILALALLRAPPPDNSPLLSRIDELKQATESQAAAHLRTAAGARDAPVTQKRLIFYNRPPKTGSTTVRIAMKRALDAAGMRAAKCFNMIEWNEMGLKTIVNRRDVDFYGCHTRLTPTRYQMVSQMRGGNVTFITNTRNPDSIILSAYLQENRDRNIADITDEEEIAREVERYKEHIEKYPVHALYGYHGADVHLSRCPHEWLHEDAMRRVAERYEVVIDLERPEESAAMVEAVTGLRPDFTGRFNERTTDTSGKMLSTLKEVDTSHKTCGNELVHRVLLQQFNIIKDRLMQNRCFEEESGRWEICDKAILKREEIVERSRVESFKARDGLIRELKV